MTNSTDGSAPGPGPGSQDASNSGSDSSAIRKAVKPKGIVRWGAVAPFAIVIAIFYIYFAFFFDIHAKHLLESLATRANGAEVDIASVHTSFWNASLEIRDIQATNKEAPAKNSIELGNVRWHMLWDALLRGKIAIDEASILDIRVGTIRKTVGRVLPPDPPPPPTAGGESKVQAMRKETLDRVQQEFSGNMFGDIASLMNGADPKDQLKTLEGSLKSEARIKELQADLKGKDQEWNQKLKSLPQAKDLNPINDRIKKVKTSGFKNPGEIQASINEINSIAKDANSQVQQVQATAQSLNADLAKYQGAIRDLDQLVKDDVKGLQARLKIPKLDAESFARVLFGPTVFAKIKQAEFYMGKAREYMPPKKTAAQKAEEKSEVPKPHERRHGKDYKFGSPHRYPLFWLKKAEISSKSEGSEFSGDLQGELLNLTDDQPTLGQPTSLNFKGDFPAQKIHGVVGNLNIDHVTEHPRESLVMKVASLAVTDHTLVDSPEAKISFKQAEGSSDFAIDLQEENVSMKFNSGFDKVSYDVEAKNKIVGDLLTKTFNGLPKVTLQALVDGTWSNLKFTIDTNLARELQAGLGRELQAKINEAQAQLQKMIDQRIGGQKKQLTDQFNALQGQVKTQLAGKQQEVDKAKGDLEKRKNDATKGQSQQIQDQGKKALDSLKSKFGF